ncbi:GPO family capsid scaffolding protein [Sphingomonas sp. R1]|uniref:GPO family capsid scaffolding protein n=1 Tax=Sphingomonas sp. R1 TaxID=399176 RepID=UPI0022245546|nr:GPO family capsid scaffolding protein [Sphingomonas sp. R1]UYY78393.1 GPO family capsid scaffolding protein [Sphingomonas sp. R1]
MAKLSKYFRAFVAGQTISDGRTITDEMIDQVVETFNRDTYSPRINIEHLAGYSPEPPFNGYGDVVAVKAQDDTFKIAGKDETRRALYVQVEGNDQLVKLSAAEQKPYPSVELTPDYAGTGKIGLVGLAFTDTPASIGTQKLQFARSAPGTLFSASTEAVAIEFEAGSAGIADAIVAGFAKVADMFKRSTEEPGTPPPPPPPPATPPANDNMDFAAFTKAIGDQVAAAVKPAHDAISELRTELSTMKGQLEDTPAGFSRPPSTGAASQFQTDC